MNQSNQSYCIVLTLLVECSLNCETLAWAVVTLARPRQGRELGFADALQGLAPSVFALNKMLSICVGEAFRYDIVFSEKKSR